MRRRAFTLIELIMVIVVIAILAASAIPRFKRDTRSEAINHMLTMIRYTQNLALHDSRHDSNNSKWQQSFWRFAIRKCSGGGIYYQIGSDSDYNGAISQEESAVDPSNGKLTHWVGTQACPSFSSVNKNISPNIFISQKYGIKDAIFNSCRIRKNGTGKSSKSSAKYISFDNFGRPMKGNMDSTKPNYSGYAVGNCNIKFKFEDKSIKPFVIIIPKETGYAYLKENPTL